MYPTYLMLTFLGSSSLISGILSLMWSRDDLMNQIMKVVLVVLTVVSGVGFYATLATGHWMYFNAFSLIGGTIYAVFASMTKGDLFRFLFWMLAIAGLANGAITFLM